ELRGHGRFARARPRGRSRREAQKFLDLRRASVPELGLRLLTYLRSPRVVVALLKMNHDFLDTRAISMGRQRMEFVRKCAGDAPHDAGQIASNLRERDQMHAKRQHGVARNVEPTAQPRNEIVQALAFDALLEGYGSVITAARQPMNLRAGGCPRVPHR